MRKVAVVAVAMAVLLVAAVLLLSRPAEAPGDQLLAAVSIPPQAYLVERIGGHRVQVQVLVRPGQSPHTYEPTPAQMAALAKAHIFFTIGIPFEGQLLPRITQTAPRLRIVDTNKGVPLRIMSEAEAEHEHEEASHEEPEHEHAAGEPDPHTWLSPRNAKIQAANICEGLKAVDPAHAPQYDENLLALQAELDALDARIAAALEPVRGRSLFVFHPAFGYFADAYGLRQVAVEVEGKSPSPKQLAALIQKARAEGARVIFVQPQFDTRAAEAVAEAIGGVVLPMDPLARDYLKNLEEIATRARAALGNPATERNEP